jgi:hypothetical protein
MIISSGQMVMKTPGGARTDSFHRNSREERRVFISVKCHNDDPLEKGDLFVVCKGHQIGAISIAEKLWPH